MYDDEEMFEGLTLDEIDTLKPSVERLNIAYSDGELSHLDLAEIKQLLSNASQRDIQKTILR